jgi:hypothetical protein
MLCFPRMILCGIFTLEIRGGGALGSLYLASLPTLTEERLKILAEPLLPQMILCERVADGICEGS